MSSAVLSPAQTALREGCALVDRSERGKLAFTGPEAAEFLDGLTTNAIGAIEPGQVVGAAVLNAKGKMLGEVRVAHRGDELWLDVDRASLQAVFDVLWRGRIGRDVEVHKRTVQEVEFALLGPDAEAVAERAAQAGTTAHRVPTPFGVDVVAPAEQGEALRTALLAAGAVEVGEADADVLRVEAGVPRWGAELDETVIPQEAGLNGRLVSFTKGCYPGQETVARLFYKGKPNRHLRGLRFDAGDVAPGTELRLPDGGKVVGTVGSSVVSPRLGPIGLALVRREAEPGAVLEAGGAAATVVVLPF